MRRTVSFCLLTCLTACASGPTLHDATWKLLASPTKASLRGLAIASAEEFWVSGGGGTLLHTRDGGHTFTQRKIEGESNELRDLQLLPDGSLLVMACQPARIYRSSDGGETFARVWKAATDMAFIDAMAFFDGQRGLCFGDPLDGGLLVLRSEDGGRNWRRLGREALPPAMPDEAGFAASGTCMQALPDGRAWIGTGGGASRVFRSSDFGKTFAAVSSGLRAGEGSGVFSLDFDARGDGVLVGGNYQDAENRESTAAWSVDGGRSFQSLEAGLPGGFRSCVARHPRDPLVLLATGTNGTDISRDGGRSWEAFSPTGFHVLGFATDGTCIAAGSEGRIARLR